MEAFELLCRVGVTGWKIASGEITNVELIDAAAATDPPVILSTGMSGLPEVDDAVARIRRTAAPFAVLQCTTLSPTPPEAIGIAAPPFFRDHDGCPVSLPYHPAPTFPSL